MNSFLLVSDVFLVGIQVGYRTTENGCQSANMTLTAASKGGGGRPGRRPSSSYMDKSVWKIFAKGTVAEAANGFLGFTLAERTPVTVPLIFGD